MGYLGLTAENTGVPGLPALHRQIGSLHVLVGIELRHRALPADLAFLQHIDAVRHQAREMDVLLGQQDRQPSFFSSTMVLAICSTISGATPSEGSSSSTSSGLPISVRATVSICCSPPLMRPPSRSGISARLGNSANSFSGVHDGAGAPVGKAARRLAADVEIFHDGEIGEDAAVFRREAEAAPRDLERLQAGDIARR